jgi:ankyrin repeat protein
MLGTAASSKEFSAADAAAAELPPLLQACVQGDVYTAKDIVDKSDFMQDLDLEATVSNGPYAGRTAVILAAEAGHKDIVELLLSRDVQREAVDNLGLTALMHAAFNGHTDVVDELLFNGATVDRVAFCGYTAMLLAANRGHAEVVRRLLAAGASPLARTPAGRNAVLVAAFNGHLPTVKVLVHVTGIELDARDDEGYSAVDAACANNHTAVATFLSDLL